MIPTILLTSLLIFWAMDLTGGDPVQTILPENATVEQQEALRESMYLGQMVEKANSDELFRQPMHPYTQALLSAIPLPIVGKNKPERKLIRGEITSPVNLPDQCRFLKRCDACTKDCETGKNPELREVAPGHFVACHCV